MKVRVELEEDDLAVLVAQYLAGRGLDTTHGKITVQVKSRQNYKSEWEVAQYRAIYEEDR